MFRLIGRRVGVGVDDDVADVALRIAGGLFKLLLQLGEVLRDGSEDFLWDGVDLLFAGLGQLGVTQLEELGTTVKNSHLNSEEGSITYG